MEELIGIMNQLQDVFSTAGLREIDLPQIAVVGTQSSGKSSVLDLLVGSSLLSRGPGVVTRCPLVLQLRNIRDSVSTTEDYAIFKHKKTEVFKDYQMVKREIEDQTKRLAEGEKGICSTPIFLTMYSRAFPNLTLVDLPGLTKIPAGSNSDNTNQQTKKLILKYIERPNCIILVVTPANPDMENCEGLKIARQVDTKGVRTLAVVTKLDLMDHGTDAKTMLSGGNVIPVKHDIIGVVNRFQKDILENKLMEHSLTDVEAFFKNKYKELDSCHGIPYLTSTIQTILITHIQRVLPELKAQISKKLLLKKLELSKVQITKLDSPTLLMDLILKFSNSFRATITGSLAKIDTKELNGGVKIYEILNLANRRLEAIDPLKGLSENDIKMAFYNSSGVNVTCYIPNLAFELLVKKQIKQLLSPCVKCVDIVYKLLANIVYDCVNDPELQLKNYPKLQKMLSTAALHFLKSNFQTTKIYLFNIIDIHSAYINYSHVDFLSTIPKDEPPQDIIVEFNDENRFCSSIVNKINRYFSTVQRSIMDSLPKLIMCFMVNSMMERLDSELISQLYHIEDLLQESPELVQERKKINESISALERADIVINSLQTPNKLSVINSSEKTISGTRDQRFVDYLYKHVLENYAWGAMLLFACMIPAISWYFVLFQQ